MATIAGKARCIICDKEKRTVKCEGCSQMFCYIHLPVHHQELSQQLDEIEQNRDLFRQTLSQHADDTKQHSLIKQIDQWEEDSIKKSNKQQKRGNLAALTDQLKHIRQENDFNELDLSHLKEKLTQLAEELYQPPNVSIQQDSASLGTPFAIVGFKGFNADVGEFDWIVEQSRHEYDQAFARLSSQNGKISGTSARQEMIKSKLPNNVLGRIWKLSDIDRDGMLDIDEWALVQHLIKIKLDGHELPTTLPDHLVPPSKRHLIKNTASSSYGNK
ncbi:unnamed protein product [Rotaria sordida]|uniref:Uncharacterized protein n=1 Tax=Rotaria sordida TaxID=392033 RepID=A0A819YXD2_9BILA|nr:unnamed protein product [Rotaria sordida]